MGVLDAEPFPLPPPQPPDRTEEAKDLIRQLARLFGLEVEFK